MNLSTEPPFISNTLLDFLSILILLSDNGTVFSTTGNSPVLGQTRIVNAGGNKIQIVSKFDGSTGQWGGNQSEVLITEILDER